MKFTRIVGRRELIQAAVFGSLAGVVGVVLFILMLNSMNADGGQEVAKEGEESGEVIPVSNQTTPTIDPSAEQFYANQYGVFSTFDAATNFMNEYPSLNLSAIIKVDNSYYIWSEISTIKEGINKSDDPPSFAKSFFLSGSACTNPSIQNIPLLLTNEDRSKYYFEGNQIPEDFPEDWQTISKAISSLSDDLDVTRLHLLKHYFELNDCLKIQFN